MRCAGSRVEGQRVTRPLRIKAGELKGNKVKPQPRKPRSASEDIRQKNSKRVRVIKPRGA